MRLLIIEDEELLARSLQKGFESEGFAVDCVFDGDAALRRLEFHSMDYDIIILDLLLPKIDGSEVCRVARKMKIATPILVLTAKDATEDKVNVLNNGADDYLIKPFSFEELLARVRALLRRPANDLPSELRVGDLSLDTVTRTVSRNGFQIQLTLKEFMLLEYLMRHAGNVLTREQITAHLWNFDYDSFTNVLDVHVKNLRNKIDKQHNEKLLETIHGIGYRIKK